MFLKIKKCPPKITAILVCILKLAFFLSLRNILSKGGWPAPHAQSGRHPYHVTYFLFCQGSYFMALYHE